MSTACLVLSASGHVAGGGAVPTDAGFLLVAALLSVACVGLADRRRSAGEIGALLLFSQPVLHVLLTLAGHHGAGGSVVPGPSMLLAHALAAAVLTVLLAGAESVAWSMAALSATVLLTRVRQLLRLPEPDGVTRHPAPRDSGARRLLIVHLVCSTPWRGPPVPAGT